MFPGGESIDGDHAKGPVTLISTSERTGDQLKDAAGTLASI